MCTIYNFCLYIAGCVFRVTPACRSVFFVQPHGNVYCRAGASTAAYVFAYPIRNDTQVVPYGGVRATHKASLHCRVHILIAHAQKSTPFPSGKGVL